VNLEKLITHHFIADQSQVHHAEETETFQETTTSCPKRPDGTMGTDGFSTH